MSIRRFAPLLRMGFAALVAACGAATDPDLIDIPNVYEGGGVGSADGSSDADSTTSGFDAPSDATGLASHSDSGDAESGATGAGQDAEVCTPVSVMDVPSSGGAACPTTGTACYPNDETSFSPTWVPPLPRGNRCTATQIGDFYDLCLGPSASDSPCGTWTSDSANATCLGCLKTPNTASAYGVFIQYSGSVVELNEAGCVALAEPCNLKCAQTWLASIECREAACTSTDCPEQSDQIVCAMSAASCSACEGYAEAAACMTELTGPDHPAGTLCAIGSDDIVTEDSVTMEDYTSVASFMCGM